MVAAGETVVVALSGGPDSVALLDLLHRLSGELGLALHVAHLDHMLRADESRTDAVFAGEMAAACGLAFTGGRIDVAAEADRNRCSLEDAARQARMAFLEEVRIAQNAHRIALGHHRDDQAETFLLRLLRGAGGSGLAAMRPVRERVWIRPLLHVTREEILRYLSDRRLPYRVDRTNGDTGFTRNRIRLQLLPGLAKDYNPGIGSVLSRTADLLREDDGYLENIAREALQTAVLHRDSRKIVLAERVLSGYHISIRRRMLRSLLGSVSCTPEGLAQAKSGGGGTPTGQVDFQSVQSLVSLLERGSGSVQISALVSAHLSSNRLILHTRPSSFRVPLQIPGRTTVPQLGVTIETHIRPARELQGRLACLEPGRACFDLDFPAVSPDLPVGQRADGWILRSRLPGDRFRPYGPGGSKSLGDFLTDRKVARPLRDDLPLLVSGDTILWVVGLRTAQPGSVTDKTKRVLDARVTEGLENLTLLTVSQ